VGDIEHAFRKGLLRTLGDGESLKGRQLRRIGEPDAVA